MRRISVGSILIFGVGMAIAAPPGMRLVLESGNADDPMLRPVRYMILDSTGRPVSDWIDGCSLPEGGVAGSPRSWGNCVGTEVYDALQVNENTGEREGAECIPAAPGARYFFVGTSPPDTYRANTLVEDFRYDASANPNAQFGAGLFRGVWNNNPPVPTQLYAILSMHDNYAFDGILFNLGDPGPAYLHGVDNDGNPGWPGDGPMWTVVFDYGPVNAFTIYLLMEVCTGDLPYPADGDGAYTLALATAFDPQTGQYTGALFDSQDQNSTTAPLGWAGPKYSMWGFRDDFGNPNGLARPGQPDVGNPPDEFILWANDTNQETIPNVLWDALNGEWFLLPILNQNCLFSDTEVGVSFYARFIAAGGACCVGTSCTVVSEAQCANSEGTFLGNGSSCTSSSCTVAGTEFACGDGDANGDGLTNNFDIDPFVLLLTDTDAYDSSFPDVNYSNCDMNCDGVVNNFDIDPFVAALTGGGGMRCKVYLVLDGANTCPPATLPNKCTHACTVNTDCDIPGFWTLTYLGPGGVPCSATIRHGSVLFPPFCD